MSIEVSETIKTSSEKVWKAITDIEGAKNRISGIKDIEILERPSSGLVGLKWKETRIMFGKEATETMWITEAKDQEWYKTHSENCGCIYNTIVKTEMTADGVKLTMSFKSTPQTLSAKLMSPVLLLFRGAIKKALQQDLSDIKRFVEMNI